jgi:hypothetical protein
MDPDLVAAFLEAIREKRDAEEFERLTVGGPPERGRDWPAEIQCIADLLGAEALTWDDPSALEQLRGQRSLEQLQVRYLDVWERVALGKGVEPS